MKPIINLVTWIITICCFVSLLGTPYGCGEQNIINSAPAVYIRKYLVETDSLTYAKDKNTNRITSYCLYNNYSY